MTVSGLEKWGDSLIEEKLDNGNTIYYVEKNGMYFEVGIFLGRTTGNIKIPILVKNSRSWGGGAVLVGAIIRIDDIEDKRTLWKVPNFHVEDMKVYEIFGDKNYKYQVAKLSEDSGKWEVQASFKTEKQAHNWVAFMRGKRYRT